MSRVLDNETILKQLNWRYATKKFDPTKKISDADLKTLLEALRLTASSYGLQLWKFLVVQDPELRKQLQAQAWGQGPVVDASHFVVLTYKKDMGEKDIDRYAQLISKSNNTPPEALERMKKVMMADLVLGARAKTINDWSAKQTYIAMGNFLTTAALMGIDTLPMEGLKPEGFDQVLGLDKTEYRTVSAIAFGYRAADDRFQTFKKVRYDFNDVIEFK